MYLIFYLCVIVSKNFYLFSLALIGIGSRIYMLVPKTFSKIYRRCGQISLFSIGGETKTEKFLITVGKFPTFLIFTTATNTGK